MVFEFVSVHLPASFLADFSTLRHKTWKVGQVGRFLAIFRVGEVFLYNDGDEHVDDWEEEVSLVRTLLEYMETPQYLRKIMFPYMDELKFAGVLPPLRTPHHPLKDERNKKGDIREAAVLETKKGESRLALGLNEEGVFKGELEEGKRVTVKLGEKLSENKRLVKLLEGEKPEEYWGFTVNITENLAQSLSKAKSDYNIGTSRYGENLYEAIEGIKSNETTKMTIAFGGPYQGLFEICEKQGVAPDDLFDVIVNSIPEQGTSTVRTEEALIATLAVLNNLNSRE